MAAISSGMGGGGGDGGRGPTFGERSKRLRPVPAPHVAHPQAGGAHTAAPGTTSTCQPTGLLSVHHVPHTQTQAIPLTHPCPFFLA